MEFSFCFRVEEWPAEGWLVIATIGDRCAGRLVVAANRPGLLLWVTEESIETISPVQGNCWEPVALYMTPGQTTISVGASEAKTLPHALPRPRVFLGDGYFAGYLGVPSQRGGGSFSVDLTSCRSASNQDNTMLNRAASR